MDYRVCLLLFHLTLAAGNPCSNQVLGSKPDPQDCRAYIVCWLSVPYLNICPDQQLYDVRTSSCQPSHLSICCNITFPTEAQRTLPPGTSDSPSISSSHPTQTTKGILSPSPTTKPSLPPIMTSIKPDTSSEATSVKLSTVTSTTSLTTTESTTVPPIKPSTVPEIVTTVASIQPITVTESVTTATPIKPYTVIRTVTTKLPSKITGFDRTGQTTAVGTVISPTISSQITEAAENTDKQSVISELPSKVTDSANTEIPTTFYPALPPDTTIKQSTQATQETTVSNNNKQSTSSTGSTITVPNTTEEMIVITESITNLPSPTLTVRPSTDSSLIYTVLPSSTVITSEPSIFTPITESTSVLKPEITTITEDFSISITTQPINSGAAIISTAATSEPLPPVTKRSSENTPLVTEATTLTQPIIETSIPVQITTGKTTSTQSSLSTITNSVPKITEIPIDPSKIPSLPPITASNTEIITTETPPATKSITSESVTSTTLSTTNKPLTATVILSKPEFTSRPFTIFEKTTMKPASTPKFTLPPISTTVKPNTITDDKTKPIEPISTTLDSITSRVTNTEIITTPRILTKVPESHIIATEDFISTTNEPPTKAEPVTIYFLTSKVPLPPINLTSLKPASAIPEVITTEYTTTNMEPISTNIESLTTSERLTTSEPAKTSKLTTTLEPIVISSETMPTVFKPIIPTEHTQTSLEPTANVLSTTLESISATKLTTVTDISKPHSSMKTFLPPITATTSKFPLPPISTTIKPNTITEDKTKTIESILTTLEPITSRVTNTEISTTSRIVTKVPESHITVTEEFSSTTNKPSTNAEPVITSRLTTKVPPLPVNLTSLKPTLATPEVITTEYNTTNMEPIATNFESLTTSEALPTSRPTKTSIVTTTTLDPIGITSETMSTIFEPVIPTGHTQTSFEPTANALSTTLESISTSETVTDTTKPHSSIKPFLPPITVTTTKFPLTPISTTAMEPISTTINSNTIKDDKTNTDESTSTSKSHINYITTTKSELLTSTVPFTVTSQETTISVQPIEPNITQTAPDTEVPATTLHLNTNTVPVHKSTLPPNIPTVTSTPFALRTNNQTSFDSNVTSTTIVTDKSAIHFPSITFIPFTQSSNTQRLPDNSIESSTLTTNFLHQSTITSTSPPTTLETDVKLTTLSTKTPIETSTLRPLLNGFTAIIGIPTTLTTEQDTTLPTSISSMDTTNTTVESSTFNTEQDTTIILTQKTNKPTSAVTSTLSSILPDVITTTLRPEITKTLTTNTLPQSTIDNTATIGPISPAKNTNPSTSESTIPQTTTIYLSPSNKPEVTSTIEPSTETLSNTSTISTSTADPSHTPLSTIIITSGFPSNLTSSLSPSTMTPTSQPTEIISTTQHSTNSFSQSSPQTTPSSTISSLPPSQSTLEAHETTKLTSLRSVPTLPPASTTAYIPPCFSTPKPSSFPVTEPIPVCRPDDEFIYPDFNNCSFYFECVYGITRRMKCKYGYQFNVRALKCMPRIEANCHIISSPVMQNAYLEDFLQLWRRSS